MANPREISAPVPYLKTVLSLLFSVEQHLENGTPLNFTLHQVEMLASGLSCVLLDHGINPDEE